MRKAIRTKRVSDLDVISCPCGIQLCYRLKCQKCTDITFVNVYMLYTKRQVVLKMYAFIIKQITPVCVLFLI